MIITLPNTSNDKPNCKIQESKDSYKIELKILNLKSIFNSNLLLTFK